MLYREGIERVVENELDQALELGSSNQYECTMRRGEVEARLLRAAAGELDRPVELCPIRDQPELWEIRWQFEARPFRLYYAEPENEPETLLALRFHWKKINGSAPEIDLAQDAEIDLAAQRYSRWMSDPPGHQGSLAID
jgi:hypothetical protein